MTVQQIESNAQRTVVITGAQGVSGFERRIFARFLIVRERTVCCRQMKMAIAFDEHAIRRGVASLAIAISKRDGSRRFSRRRLFTESCYGKQWSWSHHEDHAYGFVA